MPDGILLAWGVAVWWRGQTVCPELTATGTEKPTPHRRSAERGNQGPREPVPTHRASGPAHGSAASARGCAQHTVGAQYMFAKVKQTHTQPHYF